ncbi:MAG: glycosyl transferase family 90 [Crocinitomicaceae bacterium]|jgi:hypothetical protein
MAFKLFYYIKRFGYNALPNAFFERNYERLLEFEKHCDQEELNYRLNYYLKINQNFEIPSHGVAIKDFKRTRGTDYYLDLKDFLRYFPGQARFVYKFGDDTNVNPFPTLIKARPIHGANANSVLFKLNKKRHFTWVDDTVSFSEKKDQLVWRGGAYKALRKEFVQEFWNNPHCNVGQTNKTKERGPWQKNYLSVSNQLQYKFVFCPEGNDVATNLKWAMSSNSLCFMPKPMYETWFMEGVLAPGVHYVELAEDYSDLEDKINYYANHIKEAEKIIENAHKHVARFQNNDFEDLLCIKVLEVYFRLGGQIA